MWLLAAKVSVTIFGMQRNETRLCKRFGNSQCYSSRLGYLYMQLAEDKEKVQLQNAASHHMQSPGH